MDCGIVCGHLKNEKSWVVGLWWLAHYILRGFVCVNTKLRRFGLWVCCVFVGTKV
jgi:hypothetical protein